MIALHAGRWSSPDHPQHHGSVPGALNPPKFNPAGFISVHDLVHTWGRPGVAGAFLQTSRVQINRAVPQQLIDASLVLSLGRRKSDGKIDY